MNKMQQNLGRPKIPFVMLLIIGIPIVVMLSATGLWLAVERGGFDLLSSLGTANHGELLRPPSSMYGESFRDEDGSLVLWDELPARWTLLLVEQGPVCDQECQDRLYTTRQIHISMGKNFNRVQRVLISDTAPKNIRMVVKERVSSDPNAYPNLGDVLGREHVGLTPLTSISGKIDSSLVKTSISSGHWYVVDPAGWVMMRISNQVYFKDVISDLRFLLKNSGD